MKLRGVKQQKACKWSHGGKCNRLSLYDYRGGCGNSGVCNDYDLAFCNFRPYYYANGKGIKHTKQCGKGYLRCGYNECTGQDQCYCTR